MVRLRQGLRHLIQGGETGQAAVLIPLLALFAFIALAALAIDGGSLYLARRALQNQSDAACLAAAVELAQGGTTGDAQTAAESYVILNGGGPERHTPVTGSGVDLIRGITVSGLEVRVALQRDVPTVFTALIGRPPTIVGARSRCNAEAGGGLLPIAIKRYGEDGDLTANLGGTCEDGGNGTCTNPAGPDGIIDDVDCTNNTPPPGFSCDTRYGLDLGNSGQGANPVPWHNVVDYTKPAGSDVVWAWPQMPGAPDPTQEPADPQCLFLPPFDVGCPANPVVNGPGSVPGRGIYIVGDGAFANVSGGQDFRFFVSLDVRCITCGANRWYNPAIPVQPTTSVQTLKSLGQHWMCHGYIGDLPQPGDQIGAFSGADANQAAAELADCYDPGDRVSVIVYDGTLFQDPDFMLEIAPTAQSAVWDDLNGDGVEDPGEISGPSQPCGSPDSGVLWEECAQYTLTLTPDSNFVSAGVDLTLYVSDPNYWLPPWPVDPLTEVVASWDDPVDGLFEAAVRPTETVPVNADQPEVRTFYVWQRGTEHTPMVRTIFVDAFDPGTQRHHLTSARVIIGTPGTQDFAMSFGEDPFVEVQRPSSGTRQVSWDLDIDDLGDDPVAPPTLLWCGLDLTGYDCPTGTPPTGITPSWSATAQGYRLTIRVDPTATIARHFFKVTVPGNAGSNSEDGHFVMGGFDVIAQGTGSAANVNAFVTVLGYAQVELLAFDANSAVGRVVDAFADSGEVPRTLVPRLLPWS